LELALGHGSALWIDLRSPSEHAQDHVPGARNVPLFDDAERALIGTLYARSSPEAAFAEGRRRTRERIGELVGEIARLAGWPLPQVDLEERVESMTGGGLRRLEGELVAQEVAALPELPVLFYCWRGGMRSRSVVAMLREIGIEEAFVLHGGYRAYRKHARDRIASWSAPPAFVLRGLTGVGKTLVLRELEAQRGGWTLDLEGLAGHRSSILGMVGLEPCTQKTFESRLFARLEGGFPGVCVLEGESRKVGDVVLPPSVWRALDGGTNIELVASPERRVEVLVADYLEREENRAQLERQLPFIEERLGSRKWAGALVELLRARRDAELAELLLERYYDPLYRRSEKGRHYAHTIDATAPRAAAAAVAGWIEERPGEARNGR
jgi:tRNA 2-selenouridine synthase